MNHPLQIGLKMDEKCAALRQEFLRILQEIEKVEKSEDFQTKSYQPSQYESCVKIKGKPILPPLMTESKREECQHWKKRAIEIENRKMSEKPSRQRKDSYTLEEPSPVLLAYMERFGSVEPEPESEMIIGAASKIAQNQEELEQKLKDDSKLNQFANQQSISRTPQNEPEENPDCILENYLTDISKAPVIVKSQDLGSPGKENVPPSRTENTMSTEPQEVQDDMKLLSPIKDGPTWALQSPAKPIGNVQLFVNLIFILYVRWRFKIVCLQSKLASLAICKKSILYRLQFFTNVARFARKNLFFLWILSFNFQQM